MSPVESKPDHDVAYVTDIEGSWERLASFCANNPFVTLENDKLRVKPGATFVFGGDAIDRGPWSRKIVRTLLDAKLAQPDQVVMLAGNRDLNKLRLARELEGHPPRRAPEDVAKSPRAQLLKWIFQNTMGAGDAFEFRRRELIVEGRAADDEDVAQSYVDDLEPNGELARYLDACQLTFRSGKTLFVHGGVAEEALTVVPGHATTDIAKFDIDVWQSRLEKFYLDQLAAFRARVIEPDGKPAWENAILYQAPRKGMKLNPGSVVYGRMGDELNNPGLPSKETVRALRRCGIHRVVVGHTPSGDTPSIVRTLDDALAPFEVIVADNSRSRVETGSVVIVRDPALVVKGRVVLDDKSARDVDAVLPIDDVKSPLGKRTDDGSLVKTRFSDGWLLFRYDEGYVVSQRVTSETGPVKEPESPPPPPSTPPAPR